MRGPYRIPPYWPRVLGVLCCFLLIDIGLPWYAVSHKTGEPMLAALLASVLLLALLIYAGKKDLCSYILDADEITCMRFGRVRKVISRKQIKQVGIAIEGGAFSGGANSYIVVTLEGAERFAPKKDVGGEYISKWEDHLLVINKTKKAVEAFESFYGKFDYVSNKN